MSSQAVPCPEVPGLRGSREARFYTEHQHVWKGSPLSCSFLLSFNVLQEMVEAAGEDERELAAEMAAAFLNENLPESIFGAPKAGNGQWASVIRVMNPIQGNTLDLVQLEQNEAAFR